MTWPIIDPAGRPEPLTTDSFVLEPLAPVHNERDHAAWMSSIPHIRATPGFAPGDWDADDWPVRMSLDQNLGDLYMHADEFKHGAAYVYTVLDPADGDVIGCVYIDPDHTGVAVAKVRSWVRASRAELDVPLAEAVAEWLRSAWPFATFRYAGRS